MRTPDQQRVPGNKQHQEDILHAAAFRLLLLVRAGAESSATRLIDWIWGRNTEKKGGPSIRPRVSLVDGLQDDQRPDYLRVSSRFASSCTDFVVADLSIVDLVNRPHAAGGFVICLATTR